MKTTHLAIPRAVALLGAALLALALALLPALRVARAAEPRPEQGHGPWNHRMFRLHGVRKLRFGAAAPCFRTGS